MHTSNNQDGETADKKIIREHENLKENHMVP